MRLRRTLRAALRALVAHRTRAGLALASVGIGVAAVVVTAALGAGARREVEARIDALGSNLLVVRPAEVERRVARRAIAGFARTLELEDVHAIAALERVAAAAPGIDGGARVKVGSSAMMTKVLGTTSAFARVRRLQPAAGRFLDAGDDGGARRVAVLGARVAETLFPRGEAVGREVRLRGVPYEVVGVLAAKGVLADGSDDDNQVIVPIRTALRRVFNTRWLSAVYLSARDPADVAATIADVGAALRERRRGRPGTRGADFAIQNTSRFLAMQQEAARSLELLAGGIGALAVIVGGTGILALMLVSVRERTGEIGLRMAVGALPRDVFVQFLVEAALLALAGWLAGVAAGGLVAAALAAGTEWRLALPSEALAGSLAMVAAIGLGFGSLPAWKAARLPPVDALRAE